MKDPIPLHRLLLYTCLLLLAPLALVAIQTQSKLKQLSVVREELAVAQRRILTQQQRGLRNARTRMQYEGADHYYVAHQLEPLPLLVRETAALHTLIEHEPSLPNKEVVRRFEMLRGGGNQLRFTESSVHTSAGLRETVESLNRPVEIDQDDLNHLLALIEGTPLGDCNPPAARPHLLVTDLSLTRKQLEGGNEVFLFDVKLLKREYLKETGAKDVR